MYSLKCSYYQREFNTIDELIDDVVSSGMDPSYEITKNGKSIGEMVIDLIGFWYEEYYIYFDYLDII